MSLSSYYPLAVVGGGIVGKLAALSLGKALESFYSQPLLHVPGPESPKQVIESGGFSNRVSFIAPSSVRLFQDLNIWNKIASRHLFPVSRMKIFNGELPNLLHPSIDGSYISFSGDKDNDGNLLGYIVQNCIIEDVLDEELKNYSIHTLPQSKLAMVNLPKNYSSSLHFTVESNSTTNTVSTSLLLGCDGNNSFVRNSLTSLHFPYSMEDYQMTGLVSTFKTSASTLPLNSKIGTVYQRYLPSGPIAALPLAENVYSLVWSIPKSWTANKLFKDKTRFKHLLNLAFYAPYSALLSALESEFKINGPSPNEFSIKDYSSDECGILDEFGTILDATLPAPFPLKTGITPSSISISDKSLRIILMGDASHSIHPHAGQGLNMGIADVSALYKIMKNSVSLGMDPGDYSILQAYSSERDWRNILMSQSIDAILKCYSISHPSVFNRLCSFMINGINNVNPLKKLIVKLATN